jgi:hypothetical protein
LLDLVTSHLEDRGAVVAIDDPWMTVTDLGSRVVGGVAYGGGHVAHILRSGATKDSVDSMVGDVLTWEWFGILSRLPAADSTLPLDLTDEAIHSLAVNAEHWIFAAFDHEGWIVGDLAT